MNYEEAIKELQDNLIVIAEIERRQSAMLREHEEVIEQHIKHMAEILEFRRRTEQNLAEITDKLNGVMMLNGLIIKDTAELLEFRRRTEQNLAEITDKLNGLIGYVDGLRPPPPAS